MSGMGRRGPSSIDAIVGRNIRFQRIARGISQEELAERLGVTFQQVQKYEKGANRTSAGRLAQIASILETGLMPLFDGVDVAGRGSSETLGALLADHKAVELVRAFGTIQSRKLRIAIVQLVKQIAASV
jgi:transcriptional regulator with XRE-family HTH domain